MYARGHRSQAAVRCFYLLALIKEHWGSYAEMSAPAAVEDAVLKRFGQLGLLRLVGSSPPRSYQRSTPQRPEHVPPTRLNLRFTERKGERLVECSIEEPSTVGLPPALDEMHGSADVRVRLEIGVRKVVERTENVVMVALPERELQELRIIHIHTNQFTVKSNVVLAEGLVASELLIVKAFTVTV